MSIFRPIDRKTAYLLPPSLENWLPEDHLARFIVEVVDGLELGGLEKAYRGGAVRRIICRCGCRCWSMATRRAFFSSQWNGAWFAWPGI
jgi:hypothetical protein